MISSVLYRASLSAVLVYVTVGCFGYMLFSDSPGHTFEQLQAPNRNQDILEADLSSGGYAVKLAQLAVLFAVICASPLAILPAKSSYFSLSRYTS